MDQELIAYLDERFRGIDRRFQGIDEQFRELNERMDRRFDEVDRRFEQMDRRFEQVDRRFEKVEESIRHTFIELEGLRGDIRQVAEGVAGVNEQLESFKKDTNRRINVLERFGRPSPPQS